MPVTQLSPDKDVVHVEIFVAAPPARVFQAITDPNQIRQWWGHKGLYRVTKTESDLREGGAWSSSGVGEDGSEFTVKGKYVELDPPRLMVQTWNPSYSGMHETVVRWELEAQEVHGLHGATPARSGTGTRVRIRHSGFAGDAEACKKHGEGWSRILEWMQAFVELGDVVDASGSGATLRYT